MKFYCLAYLFLTLLVPVYSQLMFTQQPNAIYYVHTSVPLVIQCVSTGTMITYRRANAVISTSTSNEAYTQTSPVLGVDASNSGVEWDCLAENSEGRIVSSRALVFWSIFEDSSSNILETVNVRNTAISYLPCSFNGSLPTPIVTWTRNTLAISNPKLLPGSNALFLATGDITNADIYRCVLTNSLGGVNTQQLARIRYQLSVTTTNTFQPLIFPNTDITVTAGDMVHFECVGITQTCNWQHFSNGAFVAITGTMQFGGALTSFQVTSQSPTQYRALLGGDPQTTITLTINESPMVVSSIQGTLVEYEQQDISIYCERSGIPVPTIIWFHNNVLVQNQVNKYTLTAAGNRSTLQIQNLDNNDRGYYTCRADNTFASDVVVSMLIVRLAVPPAFTQNPSPSMITQTIDGNFTIACIASGDPAPEITWLFQAKDSSTEITLVASSKHMISSNRSDTNLLPVLSTLFLTAFDARDNGNYRCRATNFRLQLESVISTVLVSTDPVISSTFPNTSVVVMESGVVTQSCEAFGEPMPIVTWSSGTTQITQNSSEITLFPDNTLRIATTRQSGMLYTCTANNIRASVMKSFTLIVHSCPLVTVTPAGPVNSLTNVNTTLNCGILGNPTPQSEWNYLRPGSTTPGTLPSTSDGVSELVENGVLRVNIIPITPNNQGMYCCQAYTQALESPCGVSPQHMICVEVQYRMSCGDLYFCLFELWHLIVIIVGGFLLIVLAVCGISCIFYLIYRSCQSNTYNINRAREFNLQYKVKNDDDSDDDGEFDPTYESLPANKPVLPPVYKMAPYYNGGGAATGLPPYNPPPQSMGDVVVMPLDGGMGPPPLAYPPTIDMHHSSMQMLPDNFAQPPEMYPTEFMQPEMYPGEMKGHPDEFLSSDGQFV